VHGWHIDAIADHLTGVTEGEIRNLIINIPPRHMKSLNVSVFWPCWAWTRMPELRWMFASYAEDLALRDSVKCRRLILSQWYQDRWGKVYALTGDQNQKRKFENDKGGYRLAIGVGGGATGEGGDLIICDDPHKVQEANSEAILEEVTRWWDQTMSTRGNDPKKVRKVIVMQRVNEGDLVGHVLDKMKENGEQWEHLCLPEEYEGNKYVTSLGWSDPRTEPGELLWPERMGRKEVETLKVTLGPMAWAGQYQQRPAPAGGAIYQSEWWDGINRYDPDAIEMKVVARWLSVDTAMKSDETNDFSACTVWDMLPDYRIALRWVWKEKVGFPTLVQRLEEMALHNNRDKLLQGVIVEDKQSGTSAVQTLQEILPDWLASKVVGWPPRGDKEYRGRQASLWCERGRILLPYPSESVPWLFSFEEGLYKFPAVTHDDVEDTVSQIIIYLEHYLAESWRRDVRRIVKAKAA